MGKTHVTLEFFEASAPQGHFFEKIINPFFNGLRKCVYQTSFFCWSGDRIQRDTPNHIYPGNKPAFVTWSFVISINNSFYINFFIKIH